MDKNCEIVQDLLPLYLDKVCNKASTQYVKQHLETCIDCRQVLESMQGRQIEDTLRSEAQSILAHQASNMRRKTVKASGISVGLLTLLVILGLFVAAKFCAIGFENDIIRLVSLILTSMMIAASYFAVPFAVQNNRFFWMMTTSSVNILLLLAECELFITGEPLFESWFTIAASGYLMGISALALPFMSRSKLMRSVLGENKALFVMAVNTIMLYLLFGSIGNFVDAGKLYWTLVLSISIPLMAIGWTIVILARYVKARAGVKFCMAIALVALIGIGMAVMLGGIVALTTMLRNTLGYVLGWKTSAFLGMIGVCGLAGFALSRLISVLKKKGV